MNSTARESVARTYRRFVVNEAKGVTPTYEAFALAVVESEWLLDYLGNLPRLKRQPNLLFAAVRHLYGLPSSADAFVDTVRRSGDTIASLMLARRTQTNEPGRCAALLPVLARLPQPLALIEVGASAGLCLLVDRYGYDYGAQRIAPAGGDPDAPVFPCRAEPLTVVPAQVPRVIWRAGLDLDPVDVRDEEEVRWLENLIWPEQRDRAARFRHACRVARADPPVVERGDLLQDVPRLVARAPREATLVIFHTAVLAYVDAAGRDRFAEEMGQVDAVWVSNEAPHVYPALLERLDRPVPPNRFVLAVDGTPVAFTGPHGQAVEFFGAAR